MTEFLDANLNQLLNADRSVGTVLFQNVNLHLLV